MLAKRSKINLNVFKIVYICKLLFLNAISFFYADLDLVSHPRCTCLVKANASPNQSKVHHVPVYNLQYTSPFENTISATIRKYNICHHLKVQYLPPFEATISATILNYNICHHSAIWPRGVCPAYRRANRVRKRFLQQFGAGNHRSSARWRYGWAC